MIERTESIFGELNVIPHWYAVSTRARHEKKVFDNLVKKGVITYLPLQTFYRRWSDRHKKVHEPLFSCYIFVKINLKERLNVLQTEGVVRLVSFNGIPATIPDAQIEAIRTVLEHKRTIEKADYLTPGQKIEVMYGPLKGIRGVLAQIKNQQRLVIRLDSIMQAISVDIDFRDVKLLEESKAIPA